MAEIRQKMRGTGAQLDAYLGPEGQIVYDLDTKGLRVHDGVTLGGLHIPNLNTIDTLYALPERLQRDSAEVTDARLAESSGFYRLADDADNIPSAEISTLIATHAEEESTESDLMDFDSSLIYQGVENNTMYITTRSEGVWSAWKRIVDQPYGDTRYLGLHAKADDADLLDGENSTYYTNIVARLGYTPVSDAGDIMVGDYDITGDLFITGNLGVDGDFGISGDALIGGSAAATNGFFVGVNEVMHKGNDGAGSGFDADKLDGQEGTYYSPRRVGEIIIHMGDTPYAGTLELDGSTLAKASYPDLWAFVLASGALHDTSGGAIANWRGFTCTSLDGVGDFGLPDVRGYFPRGWDNGAGIDVDRMLGIGQIDAYRSHLHSASASSIAGHNHQPAGTVPNFVVAIDGTYTDAVDSAGSGATAFATGANARTPNTSTEPGHSHTISVAFNGGDETRPYNFTVMFCIVY